MIISEVIPYKFMVGRGGCTFEVGGRNKSRSQLNGIAPQKAYVVKDDIEHAALHNIPLWMFGFLY